MYIRRGDLVEVIAGDDRSRGDQRTIRKVLRILRDENKIVVEGVNRVYKHVRPSQRNPRGGRLSKEMPIHISNVLLYDAQAGRGVRVGTKINENGDKVLVSRETGRELRVIRKARPETKAASE